MDKYYELLKNEKFDIVEKEVKELLETNLNDSILWYLLFLSQNDDYIDFDKDNIKNELALNKALELSKQKELIENEFLLFSKMYKIKDFSTFFRLYRYEEYSKCKDILKELSNKKISKVDIDDELAFRIFYMVTKSNDSEAIDTGIILLNLLSIISKNKIINNKLKELLSNSKRTKCNTKTELYESLGGVKNKNETYYSYYDDREENNSNIFKSIYDSIYYSDVLLFILTIISFIFPIILTILSGLLLFINKKQIQIISSHYYLYAVLWTLLLVASIVILLYFLYMFMDFFEAEDHIIKMLIMSVIWILVTIFVIVNGLKLKKDFNPPRDIEIQILDKNVDNINFIIANYGNANVTYISGDMNIYDNDNLVGTYTVWFEGDFRTNTKVNVLISFETESEDISNISNTNLKITYKINKMRFENNNTFTFKSKTKTLMFYNYTP